MTTATGEQPCNEQQEGEYRGDTSNHRHHFPAVRRHRGSRAEAPDRDQCKHANRNPHVTLAHPAKTRDPPARLGITTHSAAPVYYLSILIYSVNINYHKFT